MNEIQAIIDEFTSKGPYAEDMKTGEKHFPQKRVEEVIRMSYEMGVLSCQNIDIKNIALQDMKDFDESGGFYDDQLNYGDQL